MEHFFITILDMSMTASFVILAVFAIRFCIRRAPRRFSYALWAFVGFRLIFPFSLPSAFSLFNLSVFADRGIGGSSNLYVPDGTVSQVRSHLSESSIAQTAPGLFQANPSGSVDTWQIFLPLGTTVWIAGILILVAWTMISWIRTKRRIQNAVRFQDHIYECEDIPSPFVMGFFRPRIYIPFHLNEDDRRMILLHENYHIRRRDYAIKLFSWMLVCLYWFHPLVWAAWIAMTKDMEMSCDEQVIRILGETKKAAYSKALLGFAAEEHFPSGSIPGFGENNIKTRIKHVLHFHPAGTVTVFFLIVLFVAAAAVLGTNSTGNKAKQNDMESSGQNTVSDTATDLYALKNPYVGDASADGALLNKLSELGFLPASSFTYELMTDEEPYILNILFTSVPEDRDDAMLQLSDAGNLLLVLIDNLSEVRFTYPGEDDSSITLYWNLEAADASLPEGENIKSYGQSPDKLAVLLAQITDSGTSSDTGNKRRNGAIRH